MISKMGEVMSLTIVMYHYVRRIKESQFPKIKGLEFEGFKRQLDYLEKHYNLIKASQMIEYLRGGVRLPTNACLLSFDDGYKDNYSEAFPILCEYDIPASIFLTTHFINTGRMWYDEIEKSISNTNVNTISFNGNDYSLDTKKQKNMFLNNRK